MTLSTVRGSVNILQQRNVSQHSSQLKKEPPGVGRTLLFSAGLLNSCPSRQCWGRQTLCGALAPAHSRWCHSLLMAIINITLCAHQMKMQTPRIALAPEVDTCSAVPRHTCSIHHHVCVRVGACAHEIESVIRSAAMFPKCWNEKWCRSRNPYKRRVRARARVFLTSIQQLTLLFVKIIQMTKANVEAQHTHSKHLVIYSRQPCSRMGFWLYIPTTAQLLPNSGKPM